MPWKLHQLRSDLWMRWWLCQACKGSRCSPDWLQSLLFCPSLLWQLLLSSPVTAACVALTPYLRWAVCFLQLPSGGGAVWLYKAAVEVATGRSCRHFSCQYL